MVEDRIQHYGFILVPGFSLMAYASAVEPLRAANAVTSTPLYRVSNFSVDGDDVSSSSGTRSPASKLPSGRGDLDAVFVCASGEPHQWDFPQIEDCVRRLARAGVIIGGISGGPIFLVRAGLLNRKRFTIHWEHEPLIRENYADLTPVKSRYVIDGNFVTCGGGTSALDLMFSLIARDLGRDIARRASDWLLHTETSEGEAPQRSGAVVRYGVHNPMLLKALEIMENSIEHPISLAETARHAGVSERHLSRLFATLMNSSYVRVYRRLRLERARTLLRQTAMPVSQIALATGYESVSYFAKAYRLSFGISPTAERTGSSGP